MKFYTINDAAEKCGISYAIVMRDIKSKKLPAYRIGRKLFIDEESFEKYVSETREKYDIDGYTIREIMDMLPVSYAFIVSEIGNGNLTATKVGREYIVSKETIAQYIENAAL